MSKPLLIELLTEELPPSALLTLSKSLNATIVDTLIKHAILDSAPPYHIFETPRRLTSLIQKITFYFNISATSDNFTDYFWAWWIMT